MKVARLKASQRPGRRTRVWWPTLLLLLGLAGGTQLLAWLLSPTASVARPPAVIPPFALIDQEGQLITNQSLAGQFYVTDFFFATCPSVCPRMQSQLHRVYSRYKGNPRLAFLSHTIDPEHDSVPVLRAYARRLGVRDARQWHFVTAPRDTIFSLAAAYRTEAGAEPPTNSFIHTGTLALVNQRGQVLQTYDGLNPRDVSRLLQHLGRLLSHP